MAKGVETNEFSRFVDHTLATPWETLISEIEKSLRLLNKLYSACEKSKLIELNLYERELLQLAAPNGFSTDETKTVLYDPNFLRKKINLKYLDMEFVIEEFSLDSVGTANSQATWIWKLLRFPSFFLFYHTPSNGQEYNLAMRMTILSAFTIAVKSVSDLLLPAFFTVEKFDVWNLNSIKDCVGYRPVRLSLNSLNNNNSSQSGNRPDNQAPSSPSTSDDIYWIRYESALVPLASSGSNTSSVKSGAAPNIMRGPVPSVSNSLTNINTKKHHPLYYFDGVRKLYQKKVSLINLDYNVNIYDHFLSRINHYYHFDKKLWITAAVSLQNYHNNAHYSGNKSYYVLSNPYDYTSSTTLEITMLANYTQKHFVDILTTLLNCGNYNFYLFEDLQIALSYREGKQQSIIDNEAYSTLLPSKQSYQNWTLLPYFKKANYQLLPMNIYNILYFQWKSSCIRRLLSMYILSTFIKFDGFDFHHFYMMAGNTNSNNPAYPGMKGNNNSNSSSTNSGSRGINSLFPEHFLLNTEQFLELQTLLNDLSRETKYIFGTVFPDEMIYNEKYYHLHQRSTRSSRNTVDPANTTGEEGGGANTNTSRRTKEEESTTNHSTNTGFSFTQEQQYQQLFQQVFQYLFSAKKKGGNNTKTSQNPTTPGGYDPQGNSDSFEENSLPEDYSGATLNYIENWIQAFGILSGVLPLKGPYILRLWQYCLRELQFIYDTDLPLPWAEKSFAINLNVDYQDDSFENQSHHHSSFQSQEVEGLYGKSLWTDVLYKKQKELGITIQPPDTNKPILIQKLMMIYFCILMKKEKNTYEIKAVTTANTLDEHGKPISPDPALLAANPLLSLKSVTLFRRIPLTSDIIAMQQHMLKKFQFERSKIDTIVTNHPLIRYQITVPTLLSDMALFKYHNPTIAFPIFYKWYGLESHPLLGIENIDEWADYLQPDSYFGGEGDEEYRGGGDLEREFIGRPSQANMLLSFETIESEKEIVTLKLLEGLCDLYYSLDPRPIAEQKPIFSAEKEIGKSIAYLERMSISNFLLEIIYYSLLFICSFIDQSNTYFNSKQIFLWFIQEKLILLKNYLAKLNGIIELKRKIVPNIPATSTSTSPLPSAAVGGGNPSPPSMSGGPNTPINRSPGGGSSSMKTRKHLDTNNSNKNNDDTTTNHNNGESEPNDTTNTNHSYMNHRPSSVHSLQDISTTEIIHLLDAICVIIEELELFYCKLHQLLPMIEVFMNSPFRQRGHSEQANRDGNRSPEEFSHVSEPEEDSMEINDNILQLILSWIENHEEYGCQNMAEVNYIKMMMKTCYNLQQQQQQQQTPPPPPGSTSLTSMVSSDSLHPASPSLNGSKHRPTPPPTGSNIQEHRKDSLESGDRTPGANRSIDSTTTSTLAATRQDHDWYSYDGRELPSLPSSKDFHLFSAARYPLRAMTPTEQTSAMATTTSTVAPSQAAVEPVKLDFSHPPHILDPREHKGVKKVKNSKANNEDEEQQPQPKMISEFAMTISTDGSSMRMVHEILEIN